LPDGHGKNQKTFKKYVTSTLKSFCG